MCMHAHVMTLLCCYTSSPIGHRSTRGEETPAISSRGTLWDHGGRGRREQRAEARCAKTQNACRKPHLELSPLGPTCLQAVPASDGNVSPSVGERKFTEGGGIHTTNVPERRSAHIIQRERQENLHFCCHLPGIPPTYSHLTHTHTRGSTDNQDATNRAAGEQAYRGSAGGKHTPQQSVSNAWDELTNCVKFPCATASFQQVSASLLFLPRQHRSHTTDCSHVDDFFL